MKKLITLAALLCFGSTAFAELDTATYVSHDGNGSGAVEGDMSGAAAVTLLDSSGGDMWNGGDQFMYLHDGDQVTDSFTATVRVVSQTEAIDGRWGKAGIRASSNLTGNSSNAMAQVATGNGSQAEPPTNGDHSPVPVRIGGRRTNDGQNGFENPVLDASGAEIVNNVFPEDGTNAAWLRLTYDADTNGFVSGFAWDESGTPGAWSYSAPVTDVEADSDGWYVGLAYSAHNGMSFDQITRADGLHGVTFDNYSMSIVPEPAGLGLAALAALGILTFRRKR